jgi:hypothetical protein
MISELDVVLRETEPKADEKDVLREIAKFEAVRFQRGAISY